MFKRKPTSTGQTGGSDGEAIDFGAALLRDIAATLVGPDDDATIDAQEILEKWALHVLIQTPPPDAEGAPEQARHFKGARQFARSTLRTQQGRLTSTVGGLRDVIDTFAEQFSHNLRDDVRSDRVAHAALESLKDAAHGDDAQLLKQAALGAVSQLTEVLEDKRSNQQTMATAVAEKMAPLREEIERTQRAPSLDPETDTLAKEDFLLAAKVSEEAMALFLESSVITVVHVDKHAPAKDVADGLRRVFPRRRDFIGRLDRITFAVVSRDCDDHDRGRICQRVFERVPGLVRVASATTHVDDKPPALKRAQIEAAKKSAVVPRKDSVMETGLTFSP